MTDHEEMVVTSSDFEAHKPLIAKWIRVLYICSIVNLFVLALNGFTATGKVGNLISWALTAVMLVALFKLAPVNERYRKAAVLTVVTLVGGMLVSVVKMNLLTMAVSVCTIIASYQELNALSEMVAPKDPKLSSRWHSLFYYELAAGLISGFVSSAGVVIAVLADVEADTIISVALLFVMAVGVVLGLFRMLYLKQTLALYQE